MIRMCGTGNARKFAAQKLMDVNAELGHKKELRFLFNHGLAVISQVTQTREGAAAEIGKNPTPGSGLEKITVIFFGWVIKTRFTLFSTTDSEC